MIYDFDKSLEETTRIRKKYPNRDLSMLKKQVVVNL